MIVGGADDSPKNANTQGGRSSMEKVVSLCGQCGQCPMVKLTDDHVEIGEKDNLCVLTTDQWESLRTKILSNEL
jgi:uncharacterized cysteine cluster protein YcgN (CxxCxxCC family)